MPIPVIVGGALAIGAGLGIGLPVGWKLDRWFFGETIESLPSAGSITEFYNLQTSLLNYALSEPFVDKKIYGYYLYLLIISQQQTLMKLLYQLDTNDYIEYVKNTLPEWEEAINDIRKDVDLVLLRFRSYETLFKRIYDIPFYERDFDVIREKIVPFNALSEIQFLQLNTWIINPLFNGFYDFKLTELPIISCKIGELQVIDALNNCKKYLLSGFPAPLTQKKDSHNASTPDVVMPSILEKYVILKKSLGKELMDEWFGFIDAGISKFTGIDANYKIKTGKTLSDLEGTAIDFYANMKKEFQSLRNSLRNAYSNTTAGLSGFADAITVTAVGVAALFAYNVLFSQSNSN